MDIRIELEKKTDNCVFRTIYVFVAQSINCFFFLCCNFLDTNKIERTLRMRICMYVDNVLIKLPYLSCLYRERAKGQIWKKILVRPCRLLSLLFYFLYLLRCQPSSHKE